MGGCWVEMELVGFLPLRLVRLAYEEALADSGERVARVMLRVRKRTNDELRHVQAPAMDG